jgi:hypothetical protein
MARALMNKRSSSARSHDDNETEHSRYVACLLPALVVVSSTIGLLLHSVLYILSDRSLEG